MKTLVIVATHHGAFLTIKSALKNSSHERMIVLIPRSQVDKYNKMYEDNLNNPEFEAFKDYDKTVVKFCKKDVFVVDDWDQNNTISCVIDVLSNLNSKGNHFVIGAGNLILKDPFTEELSQILSTNALAITRSRVYSDNKRLNMYHMIGLPKDDNIVDANLFALNMDSFTQIPFNDSSLLLELSNTKKRVLLPRHFNMKYDPLIGTAISARETIMHNVRAAKAIAINFWMPSIKKYEQLHSEETFGYPFDIYLEYAKQVKKYLPSTTFERIKQNGEATKYWIKDIREILA